MAYEYQKYVHEMDRKAFDTLSRFPGFSKVQKLFRDGYSESERRIALLSSAIRLSENQRPEIYNLLIPICEKLDIKIPELFLVDDKEMNAYTFGSTEPIIVINSGLVEKIPQELIATVLAHECGHIACNHYQNRAMIGQLVRSLDQGVSFFIPGIRRFLTPNLIRAMLYWDRCCELSADRAAILCDENSNNTVDVLLKLNGYDEKINREEFLKQAAELNAYTSQSIQNKFKAFMITQGDSHPRLAIRAYEGSEWAKTDQFREIIEGTYTVVDIPDETIETKIVEAEVACSSDATPTDSRSEEELEKELKTVEEKLERYTSDADKTDYAYAVACGILSGIVDSFYVGELKVTRDDIGLSNKQMNHFIEKYAEKRGLKGRHLKDTIANLENEFKVVQDNTWSGAGIGVSAKNHHLADLAHHPTPLGLVSAIVVQFLRIGTFVNKDGEWHFLPVKTTVGDVIEVYGPAVISGVLNWLVYVAENKYEEESGEEIPKYIKRLSHLVASTPILIEVAKCVDNWFGHMVSDMGGSKQTAGDGMGIPGLFISLAYELSSLPILKDTGLPAYINSIYEKGKIDLRDEIPVYKSLGNQAVPVVLNEILVRTGYFIMRLVDEYKENNGLSGINWKKVMPWGNRTIDRMITIASLTFTMADTADASIHAALESGGNWVLFAGKFVSRYNYVGVGRAAIAVVREVSNERKESQLLEERLMLAEAKSEKAVARLQEFKESLELEVSNYMAEDIANFMQGLDDIDAGLKENDSNLVIRGNITIQKVLGKASQFTSQEEFDDLMASDDAIKF